MTGKIWVKGSELRFTDGDNNGWRYKGDSKEPSNEKPGTIWIEGKDLHYVDENGTERVTPTKVDPEVKGVKAVEGSVWIENSKITYVNQDGEKTYAKEEANNRDKHSDHTDKNPRVHSNYHFDKHNIHEVDGRNSHKDSGHNNHTNRNIGGGGGRIRSVDDDEARIMAHLNKGHDDHTNKPPHHDHRDASHDDHTDEYNNPHRDWHDDQIHGGENYPENGHSDHDDHTDKGQPQSVGGGN